jgi:hypothetical protein
VYAFFGTMPYMLRAPAVAEQAFVESLALQRRLP